MNTEKLFTILSIIFVFCILVYLLLLFTKHRYLKLIESLQTLEGLPDNVYRKTGNFSLEKFQKENSMKTFVFCFNYVFVGVVRKYLKFLGIFIPYRFRINACKSGLRLTKFESILNLFLENTSKEIKTGADLYIFFNTIENSEYKEIFHEFIDKNLIHRLRQLSFN